MSVIHFQENYTIKKCKVSLIYSYVGQDCLNLRKCFNWTEKRMGVREISQFTIDLIGRFVNLNFRNWKQFAKKLF